MQYIGDFPEDQAVYYYWNTNDGSGASITRATDGTISIYKDDGTTEVTTGVTDTEDFDTLTGVHCVKIVTTDAWYTAGNDYFIVLDTATIDGETVNFALAQFSIENRHTAAGSTPPTAAAIRAEIDSNSTQLAAIVEDTGTTIPATIATIDGNVDSILVDTGTTIPGYQSQQLIPM